MSPARARRPKQPAEIRDDVELTNLDQPLFDGAEATKRDLVDYLDGLGDRMVPCWPTARCR